MISEKEFKGFGLSLRNECIRCVFKSSCSNYWKKVGNVCPLK